MNIIRYLLAAIFFASGSAKVAGLEFEMVAFERWGYSLEFMYFTGAIEVLLAVALFIPILVRYSALGITAVMIGAMATHIIHAEWPMLALAISIFILSIVQLRNVWLDSNTKPAAS
jgi:uncharacterized membrane protein YphA (DoxX/SURF4 family)